MRCRAAAWLLFSSAIVAPSDFVIAQPSDAAVSWPKMQSAVPFDEKMERRISVILRQMPVEEKVAQIVQPDITQHHARGGARIYKFGSILAGGNSARRGQ